VKGKTQSKIQGKGGILAGERGGGGDRRKKGGKKEAVEALIQKEGGRKGSDSQRVSPIQNDAHKEAGGQFQPIPSIKLGK